MEQVGDNIIHSVDEWRELVANVFSRSKRDTRKAFLLGFIVGSIMVGTVLILWKG